MSTHEIPLAPPSEAQLEVLNLLWESGEATVGELWQTVLARRPIARNTVLTLVARLEEKGWICRRTDGSTLRYRAAVARETALRQMARRLVDTAFRGSAEGLIMALLGDTQLSKGEAERIRAMLDVARRQRKEGETP